MSSPTTYRVSLFTAICLVVANMIGMGVFTSLGYQVADIQSGFSLLMLWVVGGVFAICGALSYAELAAAFPRSGGEFHFLSRIYHPGVGFVAGWLSVTVGFAAPIAMGSMAFGSFASEAIPGLNPHLLAVGLVIILTLAQMFGIGLASRILDVFVILKVVLIFLLIGAGLWLATPQPISFAPTVKDGSIIFSPPFAKSLMYVMYAYSGWNAAIYIIDEVRDATQTLPRSLFWGTFIVLITYVLVNWVFLRTTPIDAMKGQLNVASVVAQQVFGPSGGRWISGMIALTLISFVNAMILTGPSVLKVMGEDYPALRLLAHRSAKNVPSYAMWIQFSLVIIFLTLPYEQIMLATQFALVLCSLLAAAGVIVLRWKNPDLARPYRVWAYPWTPLLFVLISLFTLYNVLRDNPKECVAGLVFVLIGVGIFLCARRIPQPLSNSNS